jgi:beta-glucosidase
MVSGGFEKADNIRYFVEFCTHVSKELCKRCDLEHVSAELQPMFLTFNSPASYAINGYMTGNRPPARQGDMQAFLEVLKNMLDAHVEVYQSLKKVNPKAQIGITHNIFQVDPAFFFNPINHVKTHVANKLVHTLVYDYFTKGVFKFWIPRKANIDHRNAAAPRSLDFVGLNYYGHAYMGVTGAPKTSALEPATDNPQYTIYGEGIYRAIQEITVNLARPLKIPIYITENGIATRDPNLRITFFKRYFKAITKAYQDGYPTAGYFYWSLLDNYEWGSYDKQYGLYSVDRSGDRPTLKRTLKKSADYFVDLIRAHKAFRGV